MPDHSKTDITLALVALEGGDETAADRLLPLVYQQLREVAGRSTLR